MNHHDYFPSHAVCWLWDFRLIALHAVSDLITAIAYFTIPTLALYIYKTGKLHGLAATYPRLWILGSGFVFLCGLSHLGSFLEVWAGGNLYWYTGFAKLAMAAVSVTFVIEFWRNSEEIILVGRVLNKLLKKG